jgi:hypothetical protein
MVAHSLIPRLISIGVTLAIEFGRCFHYCYLMLAVALAAAAAAATGAS